MNVTEYCKDKWKYVVALLLSIMAVGAFLWLLQVRGIFIFFSMILWIVPFFIAFFLEYIQKKNYYSHVEQMLAVLDQKTLLSEMIGEADFLEGKILFSAMRATDKYMNDLILEYEKSAREYREYVEMWVHEIKTPLTLANLLVENHKDEVTRRIGTELQRADALVEQALYYARSTSVEKDFQSKKILLNDMVSDAVKQNARSLIGARMVIEMEQLEHFVYADRKWMTFILGQVIANSVKYRKIEEGQGAPTLRFEGRVFAERIYLDIKDNGIGIEEKDLNRIFERGFTGENGRKNAKSSGIGLYLCKKLCQKMNLGIEALSEVGEGTTITIIFPVGSMTDAVR